jgi:hypothetical protein
VRTNWGRINEAVRDALAAIPLSEMAAQLSFGRPPLRLSKAEVKT